jgi:hypothetical protein
VLASGNGAAQEAVFAGDRLELLADLAGSSGVDFRREPMVRVEIRREDQLWQIFPLERLNVEGTVRYRSQPFTFPAPGTYTVTFRAEGNTMTEVWDDRLISTRSLRASPVQIVFPGKLTVSPAPWTTSRIVKYVSLAALALGVALAGGMILLGRYVRSPLRGWLLSTGQGTPQLFVLNGNPKETSWRRLFPKTSVTIGTAPHADYPLDLRETGVEVEAEIYVPRWWDRSGALYLRSQRNPSHISVNNVEIAGTAPVVLIDEQSLEKPVQMRFGSYEMTFDA